MTAERLLTFNEVMERYKFTVHGLRWLMRTRQIEGMVRIGKRRIFFNPTELDDWVKKNRIPGANGDGK